MKHETSNFLTCLIATFILSVSLHAQNNSERGDILSRLFAQLSDTISLDQKVIVNDSIIKVVDEYSTYDSIFYNRLENAGRLGQITSPDSALKILTWNFPMNVGKGKYYTYIIRRSPDGKPNTIYKLSAEYHDQKLLTDTTYNSGNWYGALYYDIRPFDYAGGRCWVVLGLDYGNLLISRKIMDVIEFSPDNSILFGKKWFATPSGLAYRVAFEYSSDASMTLRFISDSTAVFDHLVPFSPAHQGNRAFYGPDYSYDSYTFKKGKWELSLNVDVRNKER